MGKSQRDKGKRGERELAKELNKLFDVECRRGQQFCGIEGDDVVGLPGCHVEVKRVEKFQLYPSLEQSVEDSSPEDVPIVCTRRNGKPWVVCLELDDLPKLVRILGEVMK